MGEPRVDVVVVSYRCRDLLRDCLDSLRGADVSVCVVDNASGDGTDELVRSAFPEVDFVQMGRNAGFAAAANTGIGRGRAEHVLLLNPDTRVPPGALPRLVSLLDERPEIGILGCRLEREDGTLDHAAKRSFPTVLGALGHFLRLGRSDRAPAVLAQYRAPDVTRGPVDAVNGAFMLIRRRALDEVGAFDEGFWMYMEDLDLCYRFAEAGWPVWYEPSVTVMHVKHGSSGRLRSPRLNVAFHYGMLRFYRRHYAPRRNALVNLLVYGGIGTKLLVSLVHAAVGRRLRRA
jgi:hypothetical protein